MSDEANHWIAAAGICYARAIGRARQILQAPHAREALSAKAGEARAAGDDIMRAAGLDPRKHPMYEEMRAAFEAAGLAPGGMA